MRVNCSYSLVCPKCESINVFARTRKKPKYKCKFCNCEFDDPKAKIEYKTFKQKRDYGRQYFYLDE
jgi:hypothetical protein